VAVGESEERKGGGGMLKVMLVLMMVAACWMCVRAIADEPRGPLRIDWWVMRHEDQANPGISAEEWETHPGTRADRARIDLSVDGGTTWTNLAYGIDVVRGSNSWTWVPPTDMEAMHWAISENVYLQVQPLSMLGEFSRPFTFGPMTFSGIWITPDFPTYRRGMLNAVRFKAAGTGPLVNVGLATGTNLAAAVFSPLLVADAVAGTNEFYFVVPPDFPLGAALLVVQSLEDAKVSGVRAVTVTN